MGKLTIFPFHAFELKYLNIKQVEMQGQKPYNIPIEKKKRDTEIMAKDRTQLLLHEPNLYKAFIILALPIFGANFMKAFNEMVDTYFIGQIENSVAAQAGISSAWPLLNILLSFQVGFAVAGVAVISQLLGAGKGDKARDNAGMLLLLAVVMGAVVNVILYLIAPWGMAAMGAEGETLACAVDYLRIRSFEMVALFIFGAFQAIRQAQGDTTTPVYLSVITVVINIILTGLFVRVFNMGAFGAGLATMIGQVAVAPVCLYLLFSKKQALHISRENLKFRRSEMGRLVSIAMPAAGSQALSSLGFLVLQMVVISYGDEVTAAFSIGNKVSNMLLMPIFALGSVLAAYVGQNIGAGNGGRARQACKVSRNIGLTISIVGALVLMPIRGWCVSLLSNDLFTQQLGTVYVFWTLLTQPLMALFQNYLGIFNGSGNTRFALVLTTVRLWVIRLPLILMFKLFTDIGSSGIWYAMVISNFLILFVGALLYRKVNFMPYVGLNDEKRSH